MKRQYITPCILVVKLEIRSSLMQQVSVNTEKEIELGNDNNDDFGLARENDTDNSNGGNIWDNAW